MSEIVVTDMPVGYLPDFEGKPVLASCINCAHCSDESDGWEYGPAWYICLKKDHMSNLKYFPFKSAQKCCDLHHAFTVDWEEESRKAEEEWRKSHDYPSKQRSIERINPTNKSVNKSVYITLRRIT